MWIIDACDQCGCFCRIDFVVIDDDEYGMVCEDCRLTLQEDLDEEDEEEGSIDDHSWEEV